MLTKDIKTKDKGYSRAKIRRAVYISLDGNEQHINYNGEYGERHHAQERTKQHHLERDSQR